MDNVWVVLLFLFVSLTLPTALGWFALKLELIPHHIIFGLWGICVIGIVAICAGITFDSVHIGKDVGQVLQRFADVFGLAGVLFSLILGVGLGQLGVGAWEHARSAPKP